MADIALDMKNRLSQRATPEAGSTVEQVRAWLPRGVWSLFGVGKIKIVQSANDLPPRLLGQGVAPYHVATQYRRFDGVEALYDPARDEIYLIADQLNQHNFSAVLGHELYHRAEATDPHLKAALTMFERDSEDRFLEAEKGKGSPLEQAAYRRVMDAKTPQKDRLEEFRAYLVSEYLRQPGNFTGAIRRILADLLASIRAALLRSGLDHGWVRTLTPSDLAAMSRYGARRSTGMTSNSVPQPTELQIAYSRQVLKNAAWTAERIVHLLSQYAYTMDDHKTKAFSGVVRIDDFLKATTSPEILARLEKETMALDIGALQNESQPITLFGDLQNGVFFTEGHEGRHRMIALKNAGLKVAPVVFDFRRGKQLSALSCIEIVGQSDDGIKGQGFVLDEGVPINYAHVSALTNKMSTGNLLFSLAQQSHQAELKVDQWPEMDDQAEAMRQYLEVEARYFFPDGSPKPGSMLAPNGEPSLLNKHQWITVRTENFKRYYGDWENNESAGGSKFRLDGLGQTTGWSANLGRHSVCNSGVAGLSETGEPKIFYHGTADDITSGFDLDHPNRKDLGWLGNGVYVTNEPLMAKAYGG